MSAKPPDFTSREYRDPATVVLDLATATERGRRKRLRKLLESRPKEEVVPLIAMELSECSDAKRFERLANTLAKVGWTEAMEVLARHARTQRRFPGLAIHALSRCADDHVLPLLMDLAEFGRHSQRVSAIRALGRMKEIKSVELLCRLSSSSGQMLGIIASHALKRKGGYDGLMYSILGSGDIEPPAKLRMLLALEHAPLSWRRFTASKALEKARRAPLHPFRAEAGSVLELLQAREKLLRASASGPERDLLRAAGGAEMDSALLLRGSEIPTRSDSVTGIRRIVLTILDYLVRVFRRS